MNIIQYLSDTVKEIIHQKKIPGKKMLVNSYKSKTTS